MKSVPFLKPANLAKFIDRGIKKSGELLTPWDGSIVSGIGIVGIPLSKTSISHSGAHLAPETIRSMMHTLTTYQIGSGHDLWGESITDFGDVTMHVTDLAECQSRIKESAASLLKQCPHMTPVFLGGDHSISAGTIAAFSEAHGKVGIIQFDAHHDLRNLQDGGPSNGTPFRQLIENGFINGDQLVQIGIRDFANGKLYHDFASDNGVTVYTMDDVRKTGCITILEESVTRLRRSCDVLYVSLDMDVLDQAFAPGCPAIGPGGMNSDTLIEGMVWLAKHGNVKGLDIVEIDPTLDFRHMTSRLAAYILMQFYANYSKES
ncbi:formimidoylglutamase [Fictibacillus iocasae]|uniref:Formimidoylglutamase n=1 Tax=Fictibacillus iocasae TaxID=2715437 RepID=A0ABW2NLY1_9BACL